MNALLWYIGLAAIGLATVGLGILHTTLRNLPKNIRFALTLLMAAASFAVANSFVVSLFVLSNISPTDISWLTVPVFFIFTTVVFISSMASLKDSLRAAQSEHGSYEIFVGGE